MYISSINLTSGLRQTMLQTESNLATANTEVASGVYADLGLQLGGQTSTAISLSQQSGQLTSLTTSNGVATTRLSATSSAIDTITSAAQTLSNDLISNGTTGTITSTLQQEAQSNIASMISALNTSVGGQYIFGGTNTANAPMKDASTNQTAVDTAVTSDLTGLNSDSSQITGAQMTSYLNGTTSSLAFANLYQSPGWNALGTASTKAITSQITPSSTIKTSVSARETGFQQISQAYSMIAELGGKTLSKDASAAVITAATSLLNAGIASLTQTQANVGVMQNNVTNANTQMAAQQTLLTTNVGSLENTDATALSTTVSNLKTQLEDAYSLTNSLKSLSLVTYLTGG